jgi:hypothetical protein
MEILKKYIKLNYEYPLNWQVVRYSIVNTYFLENANNTLLFDIMNLCTFLGPPSYFFSVSLELIGRTELYKETKLLNSIH